MGLNAPSKCADSWYEGGGGCSLGSVRERSGEAEVMGFREVSRISSPIRFPAPSSMGSRSGDTGDMLWLRAVGGCSSLERGWQQPICTCGLCFRTINFYFRNRQLTARHITNALIRVTVRLKQL